ncbi:hypothetical protein Tco_0204907 [Tanacetum coccineum]
MGVPKKGGMTVVLNDNNEKIPSRTVTGWRVCIDYRFFQIPIALEDQENTTFTYLYGTFAYRRMPFGLCNTPATFQRCMTAIYHDMVEDFMEVFMDDFSVFVKEGIVLGHRISGAGIEVNRAKIDVIAKLLYPTNVKGVRSFLGHSGFYQSKEDAKSRLIRLENLDLGTFKEEEITDKFPDENLMILKTEFNNDEPWYADYVNYIVRKIVPPNWTPKKRRRFFSQVKNYFWDEPYAFKLFSENVMRRCIAGDEILKILEHLIMEYLVNISKRHAFWSLNEDILKINYSEDQYTVSIKKIRRIRACIHQRPQRNEAQYAILKI